MIFEVQGPDGQTYEIEADSMQDASQAWMSVRGQIAQQNPRAVGEAISRQPGSERDRTGHPEFVPPPSAIDKAGAFALGAAEGVPVIGPALVQGSRAIAAGIMAPWEGESYGQAFDRAGGIQDKWTEQSPNTKLAGNVTGAVAGTAPLMAAFPGAFGLTQPTRAGQILGALRGGGALGGTDAAVRSGGDPYETTMGALVGGGTGALGSAIGPLAGKAVKGSADWLLNNRLAKSVGLDRRALALLAKTAKDDDVVASASARLADLGPDGTIMDLGPGFQTIAGGIASKPGAGQKILREALKTREAGSAPRIRGQVDDILGPAPVPSQVVEGIEANQRGLSPAYREVFQETSPVDSTDIARYLDREIQTIRGDAQKGLRQVRDMLNRTGTDQLDDNPVVLFETRQAIDGMLQTEANTKVIDALSTARQAIDDQLRASVPRIKEVDAQYAELARQKEAVARGQQFLDGGRTAPRPEEVARELKEGALPRGEFIGPSGVPLRLSQGTRAEIERVIGTTANDRVALQRLLKGEGDWNRARLASTFGDEKADQLIKLLDRERAFYETFDAVTRNSETARRQEAKAALPGGDNRHDFGVREGFIADGVKGAGRAVALKGVDKVAAALQGIKDERTLTMMAKAMAGRQSPVLEALMGSAKGSRLTGSKVDRVARALLLGSSISAANR